MSSRCRVARSLLAGGAANRPTSRLLGPPPYHSMVRPALAVLMFVGCGFSPAHESNGGDGGGITSDVMMNGSGSDAGSGSGSSASFLALHVPPAGQSAGTSDLTFTGTVTGDTDALTVGFMLPSGVVFDHWPQSNGPDVAVQHVRALTVTASSQVTVGGGRARGGRGGGGGAGRGARGARAN